MRRTTGKKVSAAKSSAKVKRLQGNVSRKVSRGSKPAGRGAASASTGKSSASPKAKPPKPSAAVADAGASSSSYEVTRHLEEAGWRRALGAELRKPYFQQIAAFLSAESAQRKKLIFPPAHLVFNAFNLTPLERIKVVILGQDPYHDHGQAHGLCFSVPRGVSPLPPSLRNIYRELAADVRAGFGAAPSHGDLEPWAREGVFLLNATLTVEAHRANSHSRCGWQRFTDEVIRTVDSRCAGVVFLLWGGFAHKKAKLVDTSKHSVILAAHPSPLSFNKFSGCKCFSQANALLRTKYNKSPIDWSL